MSRQGRPPSPAGPAAAADSSAGCDGTAGAPRSPSSAAGRPAEPPRSRKACVAAVAILGPLNDVPRCRKEPTPTAWLASARNRERGSDAAVRAPALLEESSIRIATWASAPIHRECSACVATQQHRGDGWEALVCGARIARPGDQRRGGSIARQQCTYDGECMGRRKPPGVGGWSKGVPQLARYHLQLRLAARIPAKHEQARATQDQPARGKSSIRGTRCLHRARSELPGASPAHRSLCATSPAPMYR